MFKFNDNDAKHANAFHGQEEIQNTNLILIKEGLIRKAIIHSGLALF